MSSGAICECEDPRHPVDPRSERGDLGITNRCRSYAEDQENGGLCTECAAAAHRAG